MKGSGLPFLDPAFLWLLAVLIPLLGLLLAWSERRRREGLAMLVQARLLPSLIPGLRPWRRRLKQGLLLGAVASVVLGMARPWWGYVEEESRGTGVDVVVCMDVSRSMLATDLKPSRIQRA
ncbi:MAG: BatA domain-containing protein, partial [Verrucomicrobiota bacterium]